MLCKLFQPQQTPNLVTSEITWSACRGWNFLTGASALNAALCSSSSTMSSSSTRLVRTLASVARQGPRRFPTANSSQQLRRAARTYSVAAAELPSSSVGPTFPGIPGQYVASPLIPSQKSSVLNVIVSGFLQDLPMRAMAPPQSSLLTTRMKRRMASGITVL